MRTHTLDMDSDSTHTQLERRWFAAMTAVKTLEAEGEVLRGVLDLVAATWRRNRIDLARLEALRDALGEEFHEMAPPARESA
jgi:hypothetical protein